jgi:precorrin-6B methylase 2
MPTDQGPFVRQRVPMQVPTAVRYGHAIRRVLQNDTGPQGTWQASLLAVDFRRQTVDAFLRERFGLVVQGGPFKGMRYVENAAGSTYSPKILGSYEQELHPYFTGVDRYNRFVNIGCAEGYFAVGVKLLAPQVEVFAFDRSADARKLCGALRDANGISAGFHLQGECTPDMLDALAEPGTLVLVDIEGAEADLLRGASKDRLARCDVIVETHQDDGGTLEAVVAALEGTHDVEVVAQQPRDWTAVPALQPLGQLDRFLAQWEGRGPEPWVVARARP